VLERGRLSFAFRPRVENQDGIQRMFMLMSSSDARHRRIVIGRNRLPRVDGDPRRERAWAYVDRVAETPHDLFADLQARTYLTKTRGVRHQRPVRVVAEGGYTIASHGAHAHLSWELDRDVARDPTLDDMNVVDSASVVVAVFNPLAKRARRALERHRAREDDAPFAEPSIYPDRLQRAFEGKRFAPLTPELLDYEGCELVLLAAQRFVALDAS